MSEEKQIYDMGVVARVGWDFHSLNNEGTVGNVVEPRTLVLPNGNKTDGVSGEMLKHIHFEYFWQISRKSENLQGELCEACQKKRPERANANEAVRKAVGPEDAIRVGIGCPICDLHGFLVERPTVSRTSTLQFGWAVGIPEVTQTDSHTHIRKSPHESYQQIDEKLDPGEWDDNKCSKRSCNTNPEESSLYKIGGNWYCQQHLPERAEQMIYHRPTRSGKYAFLAGFQPWRISFNDVSINYSSNNRKARFDAAIDALRNMLIRPDGAMTTTRLPHLEGIEGAIVFTENVVPAPMVSPLRENFGAVLKEVSSKTNTKVLEFDNEVGLIKHLETLKSDCVPFKMINT